MLRDRADLRRQFLWGVIIRQPGPAGVAFRLRTAQIIRKGRSQCGLKPRLNGQPIQKWLIFRTVAGNQLGQGSDLSAQGRGFTFSFGSCGAGAAFALLRFGACSLRSRERFIRLLRQEGRGLLRGLGLRQGRLRAVQSGLRLGHGNLCLCGFGLQTFDPRLAVTDQACCRLVSRRQPRHILGQPR